MKKFWTFRATGVGITTIEATASTPAFARYVRVVFPPEVLTDGWVRDGNMKLTPLGSAIRTQAAVGVTDDVGLAWAAGLVAGAFESACVPHADTASPTAAIPAAIHIRIATPYCSQIARTSRGSPAAMPARMSGMTSVAIIGGGPGGYEAALVAQQLGAQVTVIDRDGLGGSAVLTDCVPSKTLIATSDLMTEVAGAEELGIGHLGSIEVDLKVVNARVKALAAAQSYDIEGRLTRRDIAIVRGNGRIEGRTSVRVALNDGGEQVVEADAVLIATGARPRVLASAMPDGERILTWEQVYELTELPRELIVVGSGVTGAEFASAYLALGVPVTLISSRDRVLPGEDADAAEVLE